MRLRMPRWLVCWESMHDRSLSILSPFCLRRTSTCLRRQLVSRELCLVLRLHVPTRLVAVRLLFDEGTVDMGDNDQEALWRYFYR